MNILFLEKDRQADRDRKGEKKEKAKKEKAKRESKNDERCWSSYINCIY